MYLFFVFEKGQRVSSFVASFRKFVVKAEIQLQSLCRKCIINMYAVGKYTAKERDIFMQAKLLEKFKEIYGAQGDIRVYFAPGRVNLIGEHTD